MIKRLAMHRLLPLVILLTTPLVSSPSEEVGAAAEPAAYQAFRDKFMAAFNADDPAALESLLSPDYDGADRFAGFLGMLKADNGGLEVLRFRNFDRRKQREADTSLAVYHTVFANGSWWESRLAIDDEGRLERFIITDPNYNLALPVRRGASHLRWPFARSEEWTVLWGGLTEDLNYHVRSRAQRNALDLLIRDPLSGLTFGGGGKVNEDYFAFGRSVLSPSAGVVVSTITGVADNQPGEMNPAQLTGNTVVIRTPAGEHVLLAHLQHGSVAVRKGDEVEPGQLIGTCGNSGNSSEPHLHLQLMDGPDIGTATGLQMRFTELVLEGGARATDYAPIRGNTVSHP